MKEMELQNMLPIGATGASFGGIVFEHEIKKEVKFFCDKITSDLEKDITNKMYFQLLHLIRNQLAIELDKSKFSDILNGEFPIEMRQLVLSQMLDYKFKTKEILLQLSAYGKENSKDLLSLLGKNYGIEIGEELNIDKVLKSLKIK